MGEFKQKILEILWDFSVVCLNAPNDSGSDNDDLGNVTIDSSGTKETESHQWKQLIVVAPSSEDGSVYYVTAKVDARKGDPNSVPQWVKCGTAQCVECSKAQCTERDDSSELDRDGDKGDLKICPLGYKHHSFQKYPQFLVEDVYLRICELDHFHAIDAPNAAIIYQHANYQGKAKTLLPGKYDINDIGIENDTLSSIKVPNDWEVTLSPVSGYALSSS